MCAVGMLWLPGKGLPLGAGPRFVSLTYRGLNRPCKIMARDIRVISGALWVSVYPARSALLMTACQADESLQPWALVLVSRPRRITVFDSLDGTTQSVY